MKGEVIVTVGVFGVLLIALGGFTTIAVEFVKNLLSKLEKKVDPQIVAIICGAIIGIIGTMIYYFTVGIPFTAMNIVWLLLEALCVIIGSQVGYDKLWSVIKSILENMK